MTGSVGVVFLLLLGCPFILHWGLQYRHRLEECAERQYVNTDLLNHQVCADPSYRQRFGEKIDCQRAETEMAMGRYLCAWNLWKTHDFEPYAWLITLFNSNWLYFILFGATLMAIWAYFQKSRDLAMQRQQMDWSMKTLDSLMITNGQQPPQKTIGWKAGRRVPSARRASLQSHPHQRRPPMRRRVRRRRSWNNSSSSESESSSSSSLD